MYDILELMFMHPPGSDKEANIRDLEAAVAPNFEIEPLNFVSATIMEDARQVIRISSIGNVYESGSAFDAAVVESITDKGLGSRFKWERIGVVPVGETDTVLA